MKKSKAEKAILKKLSWKLAIKTTQSTDRLFVALFQQWKHCLQLSYLIFQLFDLTFIFKRKRLSRKNKRKTEVALKCLLSVLIFTFSNVEIKFSMYRVFPFNSPWLFYQIVCFNRKTRFSEFLYRKTPEEEFLSILMPNSFEISPTRFFFDFRCLLFLQVALFLDILL